MRLTPWIGAEAKNRVLPTKRHFWLVDREIDYLKEPVKVKGPVKTLFTAILFRIQVKKPHLINIAK